MEVELQSPGKRRAVTELKGKGLQSEASEVAGICGTVSLEKKAEKMMLTEVIGMSLDLWVKTGLLSPQFL